MNRIWANCSKIALGMGTLLIAITAHAHVGHDVTLGFTAGLLHPVTGMDHMVVILAVGIIAARLHTRAAWALPAAFVVTMTAVAALTSAGVAWQWAEYGVLVSMLAVGIALVFGIRGPLLVTMGMIAVFAAFHGYLHGAEATAGARFEFLGGMLITTIALHGLGFALGRVPLPDQVYRYSGAAIVTIALVGAV